MGGVGDTGGEGGRLGISLLTFSDPLGAFREQAKKLKTEYKTGSREE